MRQQRVIGFLQSLLRLAALAILPVDVDETSPDSLGLLAHPANPYP